MQALFVSGNRISEFWEIDKLSEMEHLMELQIVANPVAKKAMYRQAIIKRLPILMVLDGKQVSIDEKERLEMNMGMD